MINCAILVPTFSGSDSGITTTHYSHHHYNVPKELPLMKRKRPAKINIPAVSELSSLLGTLPTDRLAEKLEEVEFEGDDYGVYCKRGRLRVQMEDRFSVLISDVSGKSKQAFFGIFDGHGGSKAAEFASTKLGNNILNRLGAETETEPEPKSERLMNEKIKEGYLSTDEEFLMSENASGGTCCVTAIIHNGKLAVSNVGDCRAVISRAGLAEPLSDDQNPARPDEKTRIESTGGYVDSCNGVWRVEGSLAVSRAIGNRHLKQWVTAEPETKIIDIQPDCEFLILASDGLWDKVSNQEAVDIAHPFCKIPTMKSELSEACKKLTKLSISRGSSDDTSVMIVQLGHFLN